MFWISCFQILECVPSCHELFWAGDPSLNKKFIYILYTDYIHDPMIIMHNHFSNFVHGTDFSGMEFSAHKTMLELKKLEAS